MVAVAPGAAAPPDGPSERGALDSLFEGRGTSEHPDRVGTDVPAEARATTIHLSGAVTPVSSLGRRHQGAVPLRRIVGARAASGRWPARGRRAARVSGWLVGTATMGAGLLALWVLLFSTISGGDVWLGRPLPKADKQEQPADENAVNPPGVTSTPKAATVPTKAAPPTQGPTSGKKQSTAPTSGGSASGGSGRGGVDDPPGDDAGGARATAPATGGTATTPGSGPGSGSGSGGTSGGSGSGGGGSGSGSGGSGRGGGGG